MYNLERIPNEHKPIVIGICRNIPTYNKLLRKAENAVKNNDPRVEHYNLQMFQIEDKVYRRYLASLQNERVSMKELLKTMPADKVAEVNVALHTLSFCVDIIETNVMVMNDNLSKYHDRCKIVMFDELIKLGNYAKELRRQIQETAKANPGEEELYADTMDSVDAQLKRRVETYLKRALLLKEKNAKKWMKEKK